MKRLRPRTRKALRWLEALLLFSGVAAVGIWAYSHVRLAVSQQRANRVLDRRIASPPTSVPSPPTAPRARLPEGALIGRLAIPRLNVHSVVREGASHDTLDIALGHISGTALPGQSGNVGVAGHRDTLFRGLRNVARDDLIVFQTPDASYRYQVESTMVVNPADVGVLKPGGHSELTLVTCYPFNYIGAAPQRFIVKARLLADPVASTPAPAQVIPVKSEAPPAALPAPHQTPRLGSFEIARSHTRQLTPDILLGLTATDPSRGVASGWIWLSLEHRTVWLRQQPTLQPIYLAGRKLILTKVTAGSASGYLR